MKILFVISSLEAGGKERQAIELIKGLLKRGYECELILLKNAILYPEIFETKCKLYVLDKKVTSKLKLFSSVFKIIKGSKPDIIQSWDMQSSIYVFPFAFLFKTPFVNYSIQYGKKIKKFSKHNTISQIPFYFSNFVVANSMAGLSAHKLNVSEKYRYIYNGYDLNRSKINTSITQIKDRLNLKDQLVIGMIGNFLDAKDHKTLIEAVQIILSKNRNVAVVLIGDGPKLNEMKSLVKAENKDHFKFSGKLTAVEEYINVFDIHCLICNTVGHAEGISNAIIEGMAMEKPVVATDSGGNKEIVLDGITGYIVKPFDVNDLVEKLEFLLANEEIRISFGNKGKERIQSEFSLDNLTDHFINLYEQAVI